MGFEPPRTGQKLDFSETAYEGLEVTMDAVSLGELLEIQDLADAIAQPGNARKLFHRFAGCLESWNVTRGGDPVPPDYEGVIAQDAGFILAIVESWQQGLAQAPPPLPGTSPSGGTSPEAALAAVSQSRSPQNL
jgi:hypothetical protein